MKRIHRITTLVQFFCTDLHHYYKYRTTRIQVIVHGNLQSMPHKAKTKEGQGTAKAKALKAKAVQAKAKAAIGRP